MGTLGKSVEGTSTFNLTRPLAQTETTGGKARLSFLR